MSAMFPNTYEEMFSHESSEDVSFCTSRLRLTRWRIIQTCRKQLMCGLCLCFLEETSYPQKGSRLQPQNPGALLQHLACLWRGEYSTSSHSFHIPGTARAPARAPASSQLPPSPHFCVHVAQDFQCSWGAAAAFQALPDVRRWWVKAGKAIEGNKTM